MDESWEKAMESALEGHAESSSSSPRTLTLDGAVKCLHGRLPPPSLLERFRHLEHLSLANIGLSSLESFPKLRSLLRLSLSDNRIAGGLEFLVESGLDSLRDLDLSNNRIQSVEDLAPLANLRLISLDLYECPVTRAKDYRSRVFGMIPSLKYLDKMDADGNERPESDDEEEEEEEEEEEYDEEEVDGEDPGNSEIDGEEDQAKTVNGSGAVGNGDVDEDEDEESDADEEEIEAGRNGDGSIHHSNGFHVAAVGARRDDDEEDVDEEDEDDDYEEEDEDLGEGEEINEDEDGEEEDVVEAQDVVDSDEEDGGDGVEEGDGGDDEDEHDVEDEGEPGSTDRLVSTEGEIDGHEQGEEDDENAGEIGEADDDQGLGEDRDSEEDGESEDEEEDLDGEFLVQPIPQQERAGGREGRSEIDACNEEDEDEDEVDDTEQYRLSNVVAPPQPSSPLQPNKRRRDEDGDDSVDDEGLRSSKHH